MRPMQGKKIYTFFFRKYTAFNQKKITRYRHEEHHSIKNIVLNCIIFYIKNLSFNNFRKFSTKLSTISLLSLIFSLLVILKFKILVLEININLKYHNKYHVWENIQD